MAKALDSDTIGDAIVLWTGWGVDSWPTREDERVIRAFGKPKGDQLLAELRRLEDDFYSSDAHLAVRDLAEMGDKAADQFRGQHPEISDDAVKALRWCYTYDYK